MQIDYYEWLKGRSADGLPSPHLTPKPGAAPRGATAQPQRIDRQAVLAALVRCIHKSAVKLQRPWETCGTTACVRAGRCRGVACGFNSSPRRARARIR